MKKFILLLSCFVSINGYCYSTDVEQCTIDMAKYLSFYNYKGFIPTMARRYVQQALKECSVPFGDDNNKKATSCAYRALRDYGQLGKQYGLCNEIQSKYELQCMHMIYDRYPKMKIRPVKALFECIGVYSKEAIDCIDDKTDSLRGKYFFSEDMIKSCRQKYEHLKCTESESNYYLD